MTDETQEQTNMDEQLVEFDPKQVEADMIAAAQARAEDPTETAASIYSMYMPTYDRILPKLSTRSLRRVLNYAVKYPFHQDDVKPTSNMEKEVMLLVSTLIEAKVVMIMDQYRLHAEQLYNAAHTPLTPEQEAEIAADIAQKAGE